MIGGTVVVADNTTEPPVGKQKFGVFVVKVPTLILQFIIIPASISKLSLAFPVPSTSIGMIGEKPSVPATELVEGVPAPIGENVLPAGIINFTL